MLAIALAGLLGFVLGAWFINLAGYDAMRDTVEEGVREMRARAVAGEEPAVRAFQGLIDYIHADPAPESVYFAKGLHIDDEGFWSL